MTLIVKVSELQLWSLETGLQAKQIMKHNHNLCMARRDPWRAPAHLTQAMWCTRASPELLQPPLCCPHRGYLTFRDPDLSTVIYSDLLPYPWPYAPKRKPAARVFVSLEFFSLLLKIINSFFRHILRTGGRYRIKCHPQVSPNSTQHSPHTAQTLLIQKAQLA